MKKELENLLKQSLEESLKRKAERTELMASQRITDKQLSENNNIQIQKLKKENKELLERFKTVNRRTNQYLLKQVYKIYFI